jgi:hypothetical protein
MTTDKELQHKLHTGKGMGFICFFTDYSVYDGIRTFANKSKKKMPGFVLEIVASHYLALTGNKLDINSPSEFHKQCTEASKRSKTRDISDYIEYCCSKWLEKAVDAMKPAVHRG